MWPNPQETADSVTFTEEILNEKLHFSCSAFYTDTSSILSLPPIAIIEIKLKINIFNEKSGQTLRKY